MRSQESPRKSRESLGTTLRTYIQIKWTSKRNGQNSYDHLKLNWENINLLNRSITSNEIEETIKSVPQKSPGPDGFTADFYQTFKELIPTLLKLFHEIEKEGTLSNSLYETILHSAQNQKRTQQKKGITGPWS
jgi:hypothetical protein